MPPLGWILLDSAIPWQETVNTHPHFVSSLKISRKILRRWTMAFIENTKYEQWIPEHNDKELLHWHTYENGFVSWKSCLSYSLPPFAVPCGRTGHRSTSACGLKSLCAARGSCLITQKDKMHLYWELHKTNIFVQQELKSEPSLRDQSERCGFTAGQCVHTCCSTLLLKFKCILILLSFHIVIIYIYRKGVHLDF